MIDKARLFSIKFMLESQSEHDMSAALVQIQQIVYDLGGSRDIFSMSPGAVALYLTILLELARE